jgi:hypothetical protein
MLNKQILCKPPQKQVQAKSERGLAININTTPDLIRLEVVLGDACDISDSSVVYVKPSASPYLTTKYQAPVNGAVKEFIIVPFSEIVIEERDA